MKNNDRYATITVLLLACIGFYFYKKASLILYIAFAAGLLCVLFPFLASCVHKAWMWISLKLGMVSSTVLLTIVYFVILFPLAIVRRLKKSSSLQLKKSSDTYFIDRNHTYVPSDFNDMW